MKAQCQCGQLTVALPGAASTVVACHCNACQRRSGSPFGVLAYYPADQLAIHGEATRFERPTDEGNRFETFFCPSCGSTVYARASKHPTMIGVAVGAIADPEFPAPARSVWEQSMHRWVKLPDDIQHFPKGRG
ncbi:GFA family protein [Novosphingobium beihaiensis]|uniref:GFA family protein n=1 Tax=Novosphingobium beihaiensis TaxID=2930389 RepID=A0ABT0BQW6_9SPHN|nr:GFA family protein [Novosphingobium beihaiensis]MCJ2187446.1 GFA family protein [Novosphingobium beihaiensis]